jgi:hypothetical protein
VLPQLPPSITPHCSTSRNFLTDSISPTSLEVLFSCMEACQLVAAFGTLRPQPRWSMHIILYALGSKNLLLLAPHPPPGPPWQNNAGTPVGLPQSSQYISCPSPTGRRPWEVGVRVGTWVWGSWSGGGAAEWEVSEAGFATYRISLCKEGGGRDILLVHISIYIILIVD